MNFRQVIKVIYSNHVLNSVRKNINPFKFRLIDITISTRQNKTKISTEACDISIDISISTNIRLRA